MANKVIIIGSGMAGLTCARHLAESGLDVTVLDKGRGIGGRMATKRVTVGATQIGFDHGAQYATARDPDFQTLLNANNDACAVWQHNAVEAHFVGVPGMSALPRAMAQGLDVRQGVEVSSVRRESTAWVVEAGVNRFLADRVVLTVPAPQATELLGPGHPLAAPLQSVELAPCLTLMAAVSNSAPKPFMSHAHKTDALAWIAQNSSKPGRNAELTTWVAQASVAWSAAHLEEDAQAIAQHMLPLLCAALGIAATEILFATAHRWRFARVTKALGKPFLCDDTASLHVGGDWCLGPRVEAAFLSGRAIANNIVGLHHVE